MWFTEASADRIGRIGVSAPAGAYTFTSLPPQQESSVGPGSSYRITTGSDGALWFTRVNNFGDAPTVDRITTAGAVSETAIAMLTVYGITAGPDGALWFSGFEGVPDYLDIGRLPTNGGAATYFPDSKGGLQNGTIAAGSDGALWYTDNFTTVITPTPVNIGRVTTAGAQSNYATVTYPVSITAGPQSALWYTDYIAGSGIQFTNQIARITTSGVITNFPLPVEVNASGNLTNPNGITGTDDGITTGPDGALWFTDPENNAIGRMTTSGVVTEYPIPTSQSYPEDIAAGPDGALWFTESDTDKIGRITTTGTVTEFPLLCATAATNARRHATFLRGRRL